MKFQVQLLDKKAQLPKKMSKQASGYDLCALVKDAIILKPGERKLVRTGIALAMPEGYEAQIRPRSGLAVKYGLTILNAPGTIDSDYRGEVRVILINLGGDNFTVENGMRIAQMVISRHEAVDFEIVDKIPFSERGNGGFGHTGEK